MSQEIVRSHTTSVTVATPTTSMSLEEVGRDSNKATVDRTVIGIALAAAVAAVALLAVPIVLVVIIALLRKRGKKGKKGSTTGPPMDNPIYSGTRKYYHCETCHSTVHIILPFSSFTL